jgi:hypothetical protein
MLDNRLFLCCLRKTNHRIIILILKSITSHTCTPVCRCSAGASVFDDASCCIADVDCVWASISTFCMTGIVVEKLSRIEISVRVSVETWRESNSGGISTPLARS